MTPVQLDEASYTAIYPRLVKILVVMGASVEEAEDAAQKAIEYVLNNSRSSQDPIENLPAYVRQAARRFFIKECEHDRERRVREVRGGYLPLPAYMDEELTTFEDDQWVEHVLNSLTPVQRDVIRLVMDGASNQEIAKALGKSNATIRQHLHNARDRLKVHPEIASRAPRESQSQNGSREEVRSAAVSAPRKEEVQ
jgi:RNA polymerase sigma-70 factor (ECF subfamily)